MAYQNPADKREYQARYMRETRQWLKEHHCCVVCKKQDAFTLAGRERCSSCTDKRNEYEAQRRALRPDKVEEKKAGQRARRAYRRENRLCVECGKPLSASYLYVACESCRAKHRAVKERIRRENGIIPRYMFAELGLCARCGKPRMVGQITWGGKETTLCEDCYKHNVAAAAKGRAVYEQIHGEAWSI